MLSITEANVFRSDAPPRQTERSQAEGRSSIKILVVDGHFLIRDALRGVLKHLRSDATVLEAIGGLQTMRLVSEHGDIGLVLLELDLHDRDGLSVLGELRERHPAISVVVLSGRQDQASVAKALDLGALGFIPKSEQREVVLSALSLVLAGGVYIPSKLLSREVRLHPNPEPACIERSVRAAGLSLTERQIDVLKLMMTGKTNKAICQILNLAEPTVKNHVTAILKTLKVTNRTEAVIAVRGLGVE